MNRTIALAKSQMLPVGPRPQSALAQVAYEEEERKRQDLLNRLALEARAEQIYSERREEYDQEISEILAAAEHGAKMKRIHHESQIGDADEVPSIIDRALGHSPSEEDDKTVESSAKRALLLGDLVERHARERNIKARFSPLYKLSGVRKDEYVGKPVRLPTLRALQ